jgi:transcriptional regulator with XRE-family HTH domain
MTKTRLTDFAQAANISMAFASEIRNGKKFPSLEMAFKIYDATGEKYGPLILRTRANIEAVRAAQSFTPQSPPAA